MNSKSFPSWTRRIGRPVRGRERLDLPVQRAKEQPAQIRGRRDRSGSGSAGRSGTGQQLVDQLHGALGQRQRLARTEGGGADLGQDDQGHRELAAEARDAEVRGDITRALGRLRRAVESSDSSGRPMVFGWTATGRRVAVVFTFEDDPELIIVRPITAFPVPEYGEGD